MRQQSRFAVERKAERLLLCGVLGEASLAACLAACFFFLSFLFFARGARKRSRPRRTLRRSVGRKGATSGPHGRRVEERGSPTAADASRARACLARTSGFRHAEALLFLLSLSAAFLFGIQSLAQRERHSSSAGASARDGVRAARSDRSRVPRVPPVHRGVDNCERIVSTVVLCCCFVLFSFLSRPVATPVPVCLFGVYVSCIPLRMRLLLFEPRCARGCFFFFFLLLGFAQCSVRTIFAAHLLQL